MAWLKQGMMTTYEINKNKTHTKKKKKKKKNETVDITKSTGEFVNEWIQDTHKRTLMDISDIIIISFYHWMTRDATSVYSFTPTYRGPSVCASTYMYETKRPTATVSKVHDILCILSNNGIIFNTFSASVLKPIIV